MSGDRRPLFDDSKLRSSRSCRPPSLFSATLRFIDINSAGGAGASTDCNIGATIKVVVGRYGRDSRANCRATVAAVDRGPRMSGCRRHPAALNARLPTPEVEPIRSLAAVDSDSHYVVAARCGAQTSEEIDSALSFSYVTGTTLCPGKKRPKCFFVISSTKLRRF